MFGIAFGDGSRLSGKGGVFQRLSIACGCGWLTAFRYAPPPPLATSQERSSSCPWAYEPLQAFGQGGVNVGPGLVAFERKHRALHIRRRARQRAGTGLRRWLSISKAGKKRPGSNPALAALHCATSCSGCP